MVSPVEWNPGDTFLISVDRYHAMIEAGILDENDNVELIRGRLVMKMSKNALQETTNLKCYRALDRRIPAGWFVTNQYSLTTDDSEPEPDAMVVRGDIDDFSGRHPSPAEVGLVVEVAESTLRRDRHVKRRLYGSAGIPSYWIANIVDNQMEAYSEPADGDYTVRRDYPLGGEIPLVLDAREVARIPVAECFPRSVVESPR